LIGFKFILMKQLLFLILIISFSSDLLSQTKNIQWGTVDTEGRFDELIETNNGNFYGTRSIGNFIEELTNNYKTYLSLIEGANITKSIELKTDIQGLRAEYLGMTLIHNQLVVFYSTNEKNTYKVYRQAYTDKLIEQNAELELVSFDLPKQYVSESDIKIIQSKNGHFGGVLYVMEDNSKKEMSFGYVVLDSTLSVYSKGYQTIPKDANYLSYGTQLVSNNGALFVAFNEKFSSSRKKIKNGLLNNFRIGPFSLLPVQTLYNLDGYDDYDAIQRIHVYKCELNQTENLTCDLSKNCINKYKMGENSDGNLVLIGSFLRVKNDKIITRSELSMNGMFTLEFNFQQKKISREKFFDLSLNVYTYGLSDRKKQRIENNYAQGKLLPRLYDFQLKNVTILENGTILGHFEQIIRNVSYSTNNVGYGSFGTNYGMGYGGYQNTNTTANVTYYFKDVIVFSLKSDGTVNWMKKIQKHQVSGAYNGAFVSCFPFQTNENYNLLFTDNAKNYAENGVFTADKKVYGNPAFAKNNIISIVTMHSLTGETKREQFLPKLENDSYYIPRDFMYDSLRNTLLVMSVNGGLGNKIRLGTLKLNE
jgi:hypothetical protein